jgi:rSAM/selenodomain-associated transferase 1
MNGRATIVVIAKAPVAGRVKTRLCPPCTPVEAAALAEAALRDTLAAVASTPATARVLALDGAPGPWIPDGFVIVPQLGRGLDERLANAFAAVTGPAVLIGMDTPQVTPELLGDAIETLHTPGTDAVLGPASDGGWWAIGLHNADPRVFVGVPMSTPETCALQRARLAGLGLRAASLPELRDVDTFADAHEVALATPGSRFARTLASLGNVERIEDAV